MAAAADIFVWSEASVLVAIRQCEEAAQIALDAKNAVAAQLSGVLGKFIYPGLVVNLANRKDLPECFARVVTMRGNDRGTKTFRIESFPVIDIVPHCVTGSYWTCEATPISEKTGKAMDGSAHGANASRSTVALRGDILRDPLTELSGPEYHAFCINRLSQLVARAAAL